MSKGGRTVLAKLVSKQELDAAIETMHALRRVGVTLFVFCDQAVMQRWLETMGRIPSISVKLLKEGSHV